MNNRTSYIVIFSLLLGLTIGVVFTEQLSVILVEASVPNPGHSLSDIEGSELLVKTTGNQTMAGIKTFSSNIVIPLVPIDDAHAASKGYVDDLLGLPLGGSSGDFLRMGNDGPIWDSLLTWPGSNRSVYDCGQIGGTVFDTGSGTICRVLSSTVFPGWTQAADWQRYSTIGLGGDICGRYKSTGPLSFTNAVAYSYDRGEALAGQATSCLSPNCTYYTEAWHGHVYENNNCVYYLSTERNPAAYRVEIGIY